MNKKFNLKNQTKWMCKCNSKIIKLKNIEKWKSMKIKMIKKAIKH